MRIPIRYQFMLPLLVVVIASLLAVGIINSRLATRQTKARIEKQLQGVVSALAESSYPLTDSVLRQMGRLANAEFVLTDAKGSQLATGNSAIPAKLAADALTAKTAAGVTLGPELAINSKPYFHSSVWIERRAHRAEPSVLHILFAQDEFNTAWRATFLPPAVVGGITVVAVALVTHLVVGRVSRVLANLGREVARLADGDFSEVRQPEWNDEARDLAIAINQTARRLADYESELRRTERLRTVAMLGAGLAHEMRNAVTGCRLAVDLHAECCQGGQEDDSLEVARRQLRLMENRLQQLLHLGKQPTASNRQALDLSGLVSESVALIKPAALHAGIRLVWNAPPQQVLVHADAELLGQAVMNVLLNALDAAAKSQAAANNQANDNQANDGREGLVHIEMHCLEEESELVVTDSGDGPDENLTETNFTEDVFEPFVTSKSEGVGLGLAVAKRVVESFGGHIGWDRGAGVTKFRIRLPRTAAGVSHV